MERSESKRRKVQLVAELVEWQFQDPNGMKVTFDPFTNLSLEEALEKKQKVKIKIYNRTFNADVTQKIALSENGFDQVELHRKDKKGESLSLHVLNRMKSQDNIHMYRTSFLQLSCRQTGMTWRKTSCSCFLCPRRPPSTKTWRIKPTAPVSLQTSSVYVPEYGVQLHQSSLYL